MNKVKITSHPGSGIAFDPDGKMVRGEPDPTLEKASTVLIRLPKTVRSEMPFSLSTFAPPGIYEAQSNQYGALSVVAQDGKLLGVTPEEFESVNVSDLTDVELCQLIAKKRGLTQQHPVISGPYSNWCFPSHPGLNLDIRFCTEPAAAWELLTYAVGTACLVNNENPTCHGYDGRIRLTFEFFSSYWHIVAEVEPDPPTGDIDEYHCGSFREGNGIENPMRALAEAVYLALANTKEPANAEA